jgi:hypothetical protein
MPVSRIPPLFGVSAPHEQMEKEETSLEFSLWFPDHRVSDLDLNSVERAVLNSLEDMFCDRQTAALTIDSPDNLCVFKDESIDVVEMNILKRSTSQDQHQIQEADYVDATILFAPYVSYMDERYLVEQDKVFFWMTWKVSWEVFQLGRAAIQHVMTTSVDRSGATPMEDNYLAATRQIQESMTVMMEASIRSGEFDQILRTKLTSIQVFSSVTGSEGTSFPFLNRNSIESEVTQTADDSMSAANKIIIVTATGLFIFSGLVAWAYVSLRPKRSRRAWIRQCERSFMGSRYQLEKDLTDESLPSSNEKMGSTLTPHSMEGMDQDSPAYNIRVADEDDTSYADTDGKFSAISSLSLGLSEDDGFGSRKAPAPTSGMNALSESNLQLLAACVVSSVRPAPTTGMNDLCESNLQRLAAKDIHDLEMVSEGCSYDKLSAVSSVAWSFDAFDVM